MITRKDIVSAHNLNLAFLSKTNTNSQTVLGPVVFSGAISIGGDLALTGTMTSGTVPWARLSNVPSYLLTSGGTMSGALDMDNKSIINVHHITFADPGNNEGIEWLGGNLWRIQESPDNLGNSAGNLQFVQNTTRKMTLRTDGGLDLLGDYMGNGKIAIRTDDGWLKLNPDGDFVSGVYIPGFLRVDNNIETNEFTLKSTNPRIIFNEGLSNAGRIIHEGEYNTGYLHLQSFSSSWANVGLVVKGTNQDVGIGTTTPSYKLDVSGTGRFTGALTLGTQASTTAHAVRADRTITAGDGLTGGGNLTTNRTISHADTSAQASVNNSNGTVIQDITLDGYGHVTAIGSVDLDVRYVNVTGDTVTGDLLISKNKAWLTIKSNTSGANDNEQAAGISIGESGQFGAAALHITYTGDGYGHIGMGAVSTAYPSVEAIRLYYQDRVVRLFATPTVNGSSVWHAGNDGSGSGLDADTVDGIQGSSIVQTSRTITAGTGLTGGGNLTANITIAHADTSSQSSVDNSNGSVIQDVTLDEYGHVTGLGTVDLDTRYINVTGDTMSGDLSITKNKPWLTLDSSSSGANDNEQAAGISIGKSGKFGSDSLHITYTGDGYAHIGMGSVATAYPAYEAMRLYYQDNVVRFFSTPTVNGNQVWHNGNDGSGSGLDSDLLDGFHESTFMRKTANSTLNMNNNNIIGVNNIEIVDPGPNEGILWNGGNLWKIYESPNDLTTNSAGNLQIVKNTTRVATFDTNNGLWVNGTISTETSVEINSASSTPVIRWKNNGSVSAQAWVTSGGDAFNLDVAGSTRMQILNNGTFNIGPRQGFKPTNWGYSTSYKVLLIGSAGANYLSDAVTIAINYDPSGNSSSSFTGDGREVLFRNHTKLMQPNASNNAWYSTLELDDGAVVARRLVLPVGTDLYAT